MNTGSQSLTSWLQMVSHPLGSLFQSVPSGKTVFLIISQCSETPDEELVISGT